MNGSQAGGEGGGGGVLQGKGGGGQHRKSSKGTLCWCRPRVHGTVSRDGKAHSSLSRLLRLVACVIAAGTLLIKLIEVLLVICHPTSEDIKNQRTCCFTSTEAVQVLLNYLFD